MPLFLVEDSVRKIYVLAKDWQAAFTAWSDKVEDDYDRASIDEDIQNTEPVNKLSIQLLAGDGEVLIQREIQAEIRNPASKQDHWDKEIEKRAEKCSPADVQQGEPNSTTLPKSEWRTLPETIVIKRRPQEVAGRNEEIMVGLVGEYCRVIAFDGKTGEVQLQFSDKIIRLLIPKDEASHPEEKADEETLEQTLALVEGHAEYCSCVRCVYLSSNPDLSPSCKDPWHTTQRRETESCPTCGFEPEVYKRLRESGVWRALPDSLVEDWNKAVSGHRATTTKPETLKGAFDSSNDPPINSAIKCPNCDSMSYYTDGHHQLICSVCQYVAPSPQ